MQRDAGDGWVVGWMGWGGDNRATSYALQRKGRLSTCRAVIEKAAQEQFMQELDHTLVLYTRVSSLQHLYLIVVLTPSRLCYRSQSKLKKSSISPDLNLTLLWAVLLIYHSLNTFESNDSLVVYGFL